MKNDNDLIELVKELRNRTSAPMMDCKIAIQEAQAKGFTGTASLTEAMKILKIKGKQIAEQKKQAKTEEGLISAYIHHDGKIGALVEINCQTDFVARTDEFQTICKDIAMQVAATAPEYISIEDVPQEVKEEKFKEYKEEALRLNKPEHISDKIAENKLKDFYSQVCLLEQPFIKDEKIKVKDYIESFILKLKENIRIRRFARFELGS